MSRLALATELWRAEGLRSLWERWQDRRSEGRRFAALRPLAADAPAPTGAHTPVLVVSGGPPVPRRGGVETQLLARLEEQARREPVALLYPEPSGAAVTLELLGPAGRFRRQRPLQVAPQPASLRDPALGAALRATAAELGARVIHVEGLSGLPPGTLAECAREGPLTLALHDLTPYCPRPALLEEPRGAYCHFCRDEARCAACLAHTWHLSAGYSAARRQVSADLLAAARAVVFPSDYHARALSEAFPGLSFHGRVIAPAVPADSGTGPGGLGREGEKPRGAPAQVAFVGGGHVHKGVEVFAQLPAELARRSGPPITWHAYGGGGPAALRRLRGAGVRVHGYYRSGSLTRRLRQDGIDLALCLSVWPESYCIVVAEVQAAGVPLILFDHGAPADRVPPARGLKVPFVEGAAGVVRLGAAIEQALAAPDAFDRSPIPSPSAAAAVAAYRELHRPLLTPPEPPPAPPPGG